LRFLQRSASGSSGCRSILWLLLVQDPVQIQVLVLGQGLRLIQYWGSCRVCSRNCG